MKYVLIGFLALMTVVMSGQGRVSITIDDVPNTRYFAKDQYRSRLLDTLTTLDIPVAIFINEGKLEHGDSLASNKRLLERWVAHRNSTLGNHTYTHARCSELSVDSFASEVERGEAHTRILAALSKKPLHHFRFPYNDLGADSLQQQAFRQHLASKGYRISPYTVESSDYIYNAVYEYKLQQGLIEDADRVAEKYITYTLRLFAFSDSVLMRTAGRTVDHIYLCHDNRLNADHLARLTIALAERKYQFISIEEALNDPFYDQEDTYYKKWGISWVYRNISDADSRKRFLQREPLDEYIQREFDALPK